MTELADYKSRNDAHEDHIKNYRSRGFEKGKFSESGADWYRIKRIIDHIPAGSITLDMGCNDGGLGFLLQKRGCVVYGIDLVEELVQLACDKGVIARAGCVEDLPYPDNYFDVVVMAEVLEHLFDPKEGLKEAARVLGGDGVFIGSVPHPKGNMGEGHKADYHQSLFHKEELESLLHEFFKEVKLFETPYLEAFCNQYAIDRTMPQWWNWVCKGIKS